MSGSNAKAPIDVLRVPANVAGKRAIVGLDSCCSQGLASEALTGDLGPCHNGQATDCIQDVPVMRIKGIGGAIVESKSEAVLSVQLDNGVVIKDAFRVVPSLAIPLPATDALVSMGALRRVGVAVDKDGLKLAGKSVKEASAISMAATVCEAVRSTIQPAKGAVRHVGGENNQHQAESARNGLRVASVSREDMREWQKSLGPVQRIKEGPKRCVSGCDSGSLSMACQCAFATGQDSKEEQDSLEWQSRFFNATRSNEVCAASTSGNAGESAKIEYFKDLLETAGQMLCVPVDSVEWKKHVELTANRLVKEPKAESRRSMLAGALEMAGKLYIDPVENSTIVAQARPCVTAQLSTKLGDKALDEDLGHQRARPAKIEELIENDLIGSSKTAQRAVGVAYTGRSALQFSEALINTPKPLDSRQLFGPPAEVDQQKGIDLDTFCAPPLNEDPEFAQKWHEKTQVEPQKHMRFFEKPLKRWLRICSRADVQGIFKYDISNIKLAALKGVQQIHLALRADAQDRFDPQRTYSLEDKEFAGPVETGLIKAGLLHELKEGDMQPGERIRYISQPLIPKVLQEDGSLKRRYAVDFKPTVNKDLKVPKAAQWDTRQWHFDDYDVQIRSILDGKMWYFQFEMDRPSQLLTVQNLISRPGLWYSKGLQLGLGPAPQECIKRNCVMFHELHRNEFRSAMDELMAMSRGPMLTEEVQMHHVDVLERLFEILIKHGAKCSVEKVQFFAREARLMGMEHGVGELRVPEGKMDVFTTWPFPTGRGMRKQLTSIMAGWRWIADQGFATDFSKKMLPCRKAITGSGPWNADEFNECKPAFEAMKKELSAKMAVQMFDQTRRAVVSGDWSRTSMGATLSQITKQGLEQPIGTAARGCNEAESKLKSAEGELCVMAWAIDDKWGRWLQHNWFWYVGDQQSITELVEYLGLDEPRRFYMFNLIRSLARFQFYVVARPGKFMPLNDAMSRTVWGQQMSLREKGHVGTAQSQAQLTNPLWKSGGKSHAVNAAGVWKCELPVVMATIIPATEARAAHVSTHARPWSPRGIFEAYMRRPDVMYKGVPSAKVLQELEQWNKVKEAVQVSAALVPVHSHARQMVDEVDTRLWIVAGKPFDLDLLMRSCPEVEAIRAMKAGASLKDLSVELVERLTPDFVMAVNGYRGKDPKFKQFFELNGRLCHRDRSDGNDVIYEQLYIPTSGMDVQLRNRLLFGAHNSDEAAHRKSASMLMRLRQKSMWMTMGKDASSWIAGCPCKWTFSNGRRKVGALGSVPMGDGMFDQVRMDVFGPLKQGKFGGNTVLLMIEWPKSGRVIPCALQSKDAALVALKFYDKVIVRSPSQPTTLVSDNGSEFVNEVIACVNKIAAIRHVTVSVRNPKGNVYVERPNRWMKSAIQVLILGLTPEHWDHKAIRQSLVHLGGVMPSRTRKLAPNFLEYGVDSLNGLDLLLSEYAPKPTDKTLADRMAMMQRARAWAAFSQREASEMARKLHDGKISPNKLKVGDVVWVSIPDELKGSKIEPEFMGPYKLVEWVQKERRSAWVQGADENDEFRVPVDHIIPEATVPGHLKLNFVPFEMKLDLAPFSNSIDQVVEKELDELKHDFPGEFGVGKSFDEFSNEPGFNWGVRGSASKEMRKADAVTQSNLDKEKEEFNAVRRENQTKEAGREREAASKARVKAAQSLVQPGAIIGKAIPSQSMVEIVNVPQVAVELAESRILEGEFEIEKVIEHHTLEEEGSCEYYVKFVGYDSSFNEWIHFDELNQFAGELLEEYERKLTPASRVDFAVSKKNKRGNLCAQIPLKHSKPALVVSTRMTRSRTRSGE